MSPTEENPLPRRVVTVERDGRATVLRDEAAATPFRWGSVVWPLEPEDPDRTALLPGEVSWRMYTLPSDEELDAYIAERYGGPGGAGMHATATTDYVLVLEGRVALVLDDETVDLGPGDLVVQQGTAHAWRIREGPVRLSVLMIGIDRTHEQL